MLLIVTAPYLFLSLWLCSREVLVLLAILKASVEKQMFFVVFKELPLLNKTLDVACGLSNPPAKNSGFLSVGGSSRC